VAAVAAPAGAAWPVVLAQLPATKLMPEAAGIEPVKPKKYRKVEPLTSTGVPIRVTVPLVKVNSAAASVIVAASTAYPLMSAKVMST